MNNSTMEIVIPPTNKFSEPELPTLDMGKLSIRTDNFDMMPDMYGEELLD